MPVPGDFPSELRHDTIPRREGATRGFSGFRPLPSRPKGRILTLQSGVERLAARLATVPGLRTAVGEPLARHTTLRIGGPVDLLVDAGSERAVVALVRAAGEEGIPIELLGLGSNVLVPDEGIRGVVLRLAGELRRIRVKGLRLSAGAGLPLPLAAKRAAKAGLAGLEALSGFPSTVGGAVFMNAGCYGTEIKDVLVSVRAVERSGERIRRAIAELEPSYRRTNLSSSGAIVTRALFELTPGDPAALLARIDELNARRWAALPSGVPNAGSTFKNPPGDFAGRLLDQCGMKGRRVGGAQISEKHANVVVNAGGATAADVVALMHEARAAVEERFGVRLESELIPLGSLRDGWPFRGGA